MAKYKLLQDFTSYRIENDASHYLNFGDIVDTDKISSVLREIVENNPHIFKKIEDPETFYGKSIPEMVRDYLEPTGKSEEVYREKIVKKMKDFDERWKDYKSPIKKVKKLNFAKWIELDDNLTGDIKVIFGKINELIDSLEDKQKQIDDLSGSLKLQLEVNNILTRRINRLEGSDVSQVQVIEDFNS